MKHFPRILLIVLLLGISSSLLALQPSTNQRNRYDHRYDQGLGSISGYQHIATGKTYEKDRAMPYWGATRDPQYPERFSSPAYRLGANYIMYGMTH
jgi:hypothetical protein